MSVCQAVLLLSALIDGTGASIAPRMYRRRSAGRVGGMDPFSAERDSVLEILQGATKHATTLHMVFDVAIAHPHDPVIHAAVFEALSGV